MISRLIPCLAIILWSIEGLCLVIPYQVCQSHCENCSTDGVDIDLKCGSDGVTYWNECELNCAKEHCNHSLQLEHNGLCTEFHIKHTTTDMTVAQNLTSEISVCDPFDNCDCNYDLLLTCGTDRITYANECALHCATTCNPDLQILHYGACY